MVGAGDGTQRQNKTLHGFKHFNNENSKITNKGDLTGASK